jgi:hypothetical protein
MATYEGIYDAIYDSAEAVGEAGEAWNETWGEAYPTEARRPPPVRPAPRTSSYAPRPTGGQAPVTKSEFQSTIARLDAKMGTNSRAIAEVDTRARSAIAEVQRQNAAVRKEIDARRKAADSLRGDLQDTRETAAIAQIVANANPGTLISTLAPFLLFLPPGTISGSSGSSGSSSSLGSTGVVLLAALAASGAF